MVFLEGRHDGLKGLWGVVCSWMMDDDIPGSFLQNSPVFNWCSWVFDMWDDSSIESIHLSKVLLVASCIGSVDLTVHRDFFYSQTSTYSRFWNTQKPLVAAKSGHSYEVAMPPKGQHFGVCHEVVYPNGAPCFWLEFRPLFCGELTFKNRGHLGFR